MYRALNPPPRVQDKDDAYEVLRAAIHQGELHVSLQRAFNDAAGWGRLFVETARHVARVYAHDKVCSEAEALERIRAEFEAAIREPADGMSGTSEIKDTP